MTNTEITKKAADYISNLFKTKLPHKYTYHNYDHTLEVVENCKWIGKKSDLNDAELEIVILAAWFHDSGYIEKYDDHEEISIELITGFLKENNYPEDRLQKAVDCIKATKIPQSPQNLMEEVLCDSDLAHLGQKKYFENAELLRVEWEKVLDKQLTNSEWFNNGIEFFASHKYYTKFARKEFEEQKAANFRKLQKRYRKRLYEESQRSEKNAKIEFEKEKLHIQKQRLELKKDAEEKLAVEKEKIAFKKEAEKKAERGVETMFRNTVRTHVEFSAMADSKANIMISVNTLLIGVIVTIMIRKLDSNPHLTIPTFLLLAVALVCIIFAVLVTRPKITSGRFTKDDIYKKKTNLLFFGNFFNMELPDFEWGMKEMMNDKEFLYSSMIKDFYFLGQVLGKKYKHLRICYTIFMFGIIAAVLAYVAAVLLYPGATNLNLLEDVGGVLTFGVHHLC